MSSQSRLEQFDSCIITIDIPEQEVRAGDRCVLLDRMAASAPGQPGAWIVEVMSDCEPYKDDSRDNWTPTIAEDHLQRVLYE